MPISAMDETLAHQTPETFDQVSTSDRNFYDRYYFNLHSKSDELFMVIGIGQRVKVRLAEAVPVTGGIALDLLEIDSKQVKPGRRSPAGQSPRRKANKAKRKGSKVKRKVTRTRR